MEALNEKYLLSICMALGGFEEREVNDDGKATVKQVYVPGDEVMECLKDLKRVLRKDDETEERAVFLTLGKWQILQNHLVPLLISADASESFKLVAAIGMHDGTLRGPESVLLTRIMQLREYAGWKAVVLEILFYIFSDRDPDEIFHGPRSKLRKAISEERLTVAKAQPASSRHSRFGGTVSVNLGVRLQSDHKLIIDIDSEKDTITEEHVVQFLSLITFFLGYQTLAIKVPPRQTPCLIHFQISKEASKYGFDTVSEILNIRGVVFILRKIGIYEEGKVQQSQVSS
ncbi:Topoisomerase 1-associated factor 1 [Phlyctochytrium bullatum]|nr:Topoisomerase 1-associated factor 1 [Phlyctochytrium bullatum]